MITHRVEVTPAALLLARGGSIGAAQAITGEAIGKVTAQTSPGYFEVHAAWVAYVVDTSGPLGLRLTDWDPVTPIPDGTILLRCTAYTAAKEPEA